MSLVQKFHRGEEGMESIQVVMILAAAAVIITGVTAIWNSVKGLLQTNINGFVGSTTFDPNAKPTP